MTARKPIVALSANALKGDDERCREAGMDDYLTRPLIADRLISIVRSHLSRVEKSSANPLRAAPGIEP